MATKSQAVHRRADNPAQLPPGTVVDLFLQSIDRHPETPAFLRRTTSGWQPVTHRAVLEEVRAVAHALRTEQGVQRGHRVALLSENRQEWAYTDYALLCIGAFTVPVYPTLPASQMIPILRDSGAHAIVVSTAAQLAKIREIREALPELRSIVVMDDVAERGDARAWSEFVAAGRAGMPGEDAFREEALRAQPEDVATLIYTSGTTGTPKGVMLTHGNLFSNVYASFSDFPLGPDDTSLSFLPLSHSFQRMVDYGMFWVGTAIAHLDDIDQVGASLQEVKPTVAAAVPRVYEKLYAKVLSADGIKRRLVLWARSVALEAAELKLAGRDMPTGLRIQHAIADRLVFAKLRAALGGRIRFFISGGAPLAPQVAKFFYGAGIMILEGYGLTETSPVTNVNYPDALRIGTVGRPIRGTEIEIADDGEILIRGPQIMKGYWNNDDATREVIDDEGWFHTGDIGTLDEDGYLRITDRKKELLVTAGGKNVAPQPIQNAMKLSPFVADALMIGDRRPYPILLVVPNFNTLEAWAKQAGLRWSERDELVAMPEVRRRYEEEMEARLGDFARYERPKKALVLGREFSLEKGEITPSLKAKRRVIEEGFADGIEALYAEPAPPEPEGASAHP